MSKVELLEIERVLKQELAPVGIQNVEMHEGRDHDEDLAIFVTATLVPGSPPLSGQRSLSAKVAVAHALRKADDQRLPYVYLKRPDDECPLDDLMPASRRNDP